MTVWHCQGWIGDPVEGMAFHTSRRMVKFVQDWDREGGEWHAPPQQSNAGVEPRLGNHPNELSIDKLVRYQAANVTTNCRQNRYRVGDDSTTFATDDLLELGTLLLT